MPERIARLKSTLAELEAELESLDSVDQETRAALEEAVGEIQAALRKDRPQDLAHPSLTDRLQDAAAHFEASHPTLYGIISRTIDGLGQLGI